ncbi:MAG: HAMP domain-containing sensor histidine kinase [Patescibacteria group bacterium]|nr:HAMP domain-containing sensor histidine kinase [Patescibacteria group bacterium]
MLKFFQKIIDFIKKYPGILYSLMLIIVIPLALFYNTLFTARSFQKNIDINLQTKALMVEDVFSIFVSDIFLESDVLQQKIQEITKNNSEIIDLRVMKENSEGEFEIIASQDIKENNKIISDPSLALSWSQDQTIANLIAKDEIRFWKVTKPIYTKESNEKIGLVSMALSLEQADALLVDSLSRAYLIVIVLVILCLFLIIQHTRLFGYVALSKRLSEIDKMKDNFIRMATHDLQSPITNIRGYTAVLKEEIEFLLNKDQKKLFYRVEVSVKNLSDLMYDILEVSRIEQSRLDFTAKKVSVNNLVNEVIEEFKPKAEEKDLCLIFSASENSANIFVNPMRFKQIVSNLVGNAVKYTLKGKIEVNARVNTAKKQSIITIQDTGLGISAEAQKRLFERFYRVKTRETADIQGTGLGLWISKHICEKMNGKIFIESIAGIGTKFTIIFPLAS